MIALIDEAHQRRCEFRGGPQISTFWGLQKKESERERERERERGVTLKISIPSAYVNRKLKRSIVLLG